MSDRAYLIGDVVWWAVASLILTYWLGAVADHTLHTGSWGWTLIVPVGFILRAVLLVMDR